MYIHTVKFMGAFPDGDKIVEIDQPNGGGGTYHIMVGKRHWGMIVKYKNGWQVRFQNPDSDYCYGDMQPLLDLILPEKQIS